MPATATMKIANPFSGAGLEGAITENEPLAPSTWYRIGGPARWMIRPRNVEELKLAAQRCVENAIPIYVLGLGANLVQLVMQGIFAGAGATYLFTRSVVLLGAGRAAVFPSLVPGFTLLIGFLALGEVPSLAQLAGFALVLAGFRLTQKS